jgi:NADH:ubiquinone oxidoreductase subunit 6 (subunit J)
VHIHLATPTTSEQIGDAIFSTYLVPFEVASVLLLAALVGAIVLARRD